MSVNIKNFNAKKFRPNNTQFFNDISKFDVPSPEEELMYFNLAKKGDKEAKDKLFMGHQRFIYSLAKHLSCNPETILDYVSEGNIGLSIAFDKYDPTVGVRFITFASYYIRREMNLYYERVEKIISQSNKQKYKSKINKIKHDYFHKYGVMPNSEEIIYQLEIKYNIIVKNKSDVYECSVNSINIDKNDEHYHSELDNLYNKKTYSQNEYENDIEKTHIKCVVADLLNKLKERDADIIKMSFGIDCDRECSTEEIADKYNITTANVNNIKNKVLKQIKENYIYREVV